MWLLKLVAEVFWYQNEYYEVMTYLVCQVLLSAVFVLYLLLPAGI